MSEYPPEWNQLLDQVFQDYGLLICGWSADWDSALVEAIARTPGRRYPMFWDQRSSKGETAKRLVTSRSGLLIPVTSADALFTGLYDRVQALKRLAEPPLTTAIAIARLKRYLHDPVRRIDLHDLVTDTVAEVTKKAAASPTYLGSFEGEVLEDLFGKLLTDVTPALHLLVTGTYHDRNGEHVDLWVDGLQRLMTARSTIEGTFQDAPDQARHYPALLALRAMGITSVHTGTDNLLIRLLTEATWRDRYNNRARIPAAHALHDHKVLDANIINAFPRWQDQKWLYPQSHLLRSDLREILLPLLPDADDYKWANDRYEYRVALMQHRNQDVPGSYRSAPGEFLGEWQWDDNGLPLAEVDFRATAGQAADD